MYSYTHDKKTGGLLLNSSPTGFSKEPRPVYSSELDLLGFNNFWKYDKQTDYPYMWAEANQYFYRGTLVAKLKGGNICEAPEIILSNDDLDKPIMPESEGTSLRPIDVAAMAEANREIIEIIEHTTIKKIVATYSKYKNKLDCFHVAFSGGKDSCVLLDLVKKSLPKGSFVVVFGDTGMEFPDTYDVIRRVKEQCTRDEIPFHIAKSHLDPEDSWKMFGPPSRVLRWCCSVHKSAPQTLKLREITGKSDFVGLDFVGVRGHESLARSTYNYENYGKKQSGQYSHNPLLEWTSAEIWSYIFANNVTINGTYKKGNSRAGCLFCPMSGGTSDYLRHANYPREIDSYVDLVMNSYGGEHKDGNAESYVFNGGWNARKNGRELMNNASRYIEGIADGIITITITNPSSDWIEWMRTIGDLRESNGNYSVWFAGEAISFSIQETKNGYNVIMPEIVLKERPTLGKLFRRVFRKASYCKGCQVCEANCQNGCISFTYGKVKINDCMRCHECLMIDSGCLLFHSLRHPQGGGNFMKKSINSFADHAPKIEWLRSYFELKQRFFLEHSLGPMMYDMFKRFLKDAHLHEKNNFTPFAELISKIGWETDIAQGLILVNLVSENPQMKWYVKNIDIGNIYARQTVEDMLTAEDIKPKDAKSIVKSYKRITETPLGTSLGWGHVTENGELVRTKCSISNPCVVLYGLFKFAEDCNDYKEFTLSMLLDDDTNRDGISPTRTFGLKREDMPPILLGLSAKYPEFIVASFTHDLERITLAKDKTSKDVLNLFKGDDAGER